MSLGLIGSGQYGAQPGLLGQNNTPLYHQAFWADLPLLEQVFDLCFRWLSVVRR